MAKRDANRGDFDFYGGYDITPRAQMTFDPAINPRARNYLDKDDALLPARIIMYPKDEKFSDDIQPQRSNAHTGRSPGGRLFVCYYSGAADEEAGNYMMVTRSDDEGRSFYNFLVIDPPVPETTRCFDCCVWSDNLDRLWIFWSQSYMGFDGRLGVWAIRCDHPDTDPMVFTEPRRIANGIVYTKPIVLSSGEWLLPCSIWDPRVAQEWNAQHYWLNYLPEEMGTNIYCSRDNGETFRRIGNARFAFANFDEASIIERRDGSLWMLIRGLNCVGETFSTDKGHTWTIPHQNRRMNFPDTHFSLMRLKSGNLCLLANYRADMFSWYCGRNNLTAMISRDEGRTWDSKLLIDEREGTENPDFIEGENGAIYIGYGRAPTIAGETLMAIIHEEDILAGRIVNPDSRLRILVGKAKGIAKRDNYPKICQLARDWGIEL